MKMILFVLIVVLTVCENNADAGFTLTFPSSPAALMPTSTLANIAAVQATYAALPLPDTANGMTNTPVYFCDCGTGSDPACIAGSDSTGAGTSASPYQTIAKAATTLNASSSGSTVALCKGGAFNESTFFTYTNSSCSAGAVGVPNYCRDLREYSSPNFSASEQPRINQPSGATYAFASQSSSGGSGLRVMNLDFEGNGSAQYGIFIYGSTGTIKHDILFANNTINGFGGAIQEQYGDATHSNQNIWAVGNNITNNISMGWLGGSSGDNISYNYMLNNGGDQSTDHNIYASSHYGATGFTITNNYVWGQSGTTCSGPMLVVHGEQTNMVIDHNYVGTSSTSNGCYGIAVSNGGYSVQFGTDEWFRNTIISNNTVVNGGLEALEVGECNICSIVNNTIINLTSTGYYSIAAPSESAPSGDDLSTNITVANNTIYYGSTGTKYAISSLANEGTSHVLANNTIYNATGAISCFNLTVPTSGYAFMNNNNCYSVGTYLWESHNGSTLATWRTYSGFDGASTYGDPLFTNTGATPPNFTPATGSPLLGAGSHTYAPALDALGATRPNPPSVGAFE